MTKAAQDVKQSARIAGDGNIIVQVSGDGVQVAMGRPHLALIPPRNRIPRKERLEAVDLLNPYVRPFALVGRDADMESLWDWLHSARPIAVRTVTGRAGAGKTRAAIELIERLNTEKAGQWWAGFVHGRELRRFADQQNLADWGWAQPTLIVVDYAGSLIEPLRDWLGDLAQNATRADVKALRLLLLEREASSEEGWLQSLCQGGYSEAGVRDLFDPITPKRLDRLDTVKKRCVVLGRMLEAACKVSNQRVPTLPAPGQSARFDRQLETAVWEDPLYLMMAALLSLHSDLVEVVDLPRTGLAMQLVEHEIKRLTEGAPSHSAERLPVHLAAFAAMGDGLSQEQALEIAEQESAVLRLEYPGGAGALVSRVHEVFSAPDYGLAPVVPDILAEALALRALRQCSDVQQEAAISRAVKYLGAQRVVAFIIRTVQDFCPAGETAPLTWLESLIKSGVADDPALLSVIDTAMPRQTLVLLEKAVEVGLLLVERSGKLVRHRPTEPVGAEHGRLLNNLSVRLSNLGRREDALTKAQEAAGIYEQLAQARPDAFLPYLATSLNNLANMLSAVGRREDALTKAQEAAGIYEQLAQARPDAFLPYLATSLNNLANMLSAVGRREDALTKAQEAAGIYEQLAQARPDAFLPYLAGSLNNLANMLSEVGRREDALTKAQEAVRIREQLAQARPDAFLPYLAGSLNNLANRLSEVGRREDALTKAQEAAGIYEQLAQARPDAFLPYLATSLNNLANMLSEVGRREDALTKAQEAVRIREQLAQARPDAFLPYLAMSLNNLANMLSEVGRREDALTKAQEAAGIYEQLAQARPDAFLPYLAGSLNNLANRLSEVGRREDALTKAQEAAGIYEQLAQARPDAFLPDLAMSLNNLANMLSEVGRREDALTKAQEAAEIYEQLAQARPDAFLPYLATSLNNLANMLGEVGRREDALTKAQEAVRIREQLKKLKQDTTEE